MKKIIALILCLLLVFSVCGCAKSPEAKQKDYNKFLTSVSDCEVVAVNARVHYAKNGDVFLISDIENKTSAEVKDVVVAFAAWDESGNPLPIHTDENPENAKNGIEVTLANAKVAPNSIWEATGGIAVCEDTKNVCYVTAFVIKYSKDGKMVEAEDLYVDWQEQYLGTVLEEHHYTQLTPFKKEQ